MLGRYRVVDLTDERGNLAAFILAGLGAEVVLVEPLGGSGGRRRGPFAGGDADSEASLTFWAWNRGKRSVVIDLDTASGQQSLAQLCADADVVIESGAVPVDLAALRRADSALVTVSITPFGGSGPKARWPATDLTVNAAGCQLAITGDDDRPPVRTAVPQAFLHASADAAVGALLALRKRSMSGCGQHVEVSAQRSMMQATQSYSLAVPLGGTAARRMSGGVKTGGLDVKLLWPCADGFVSVTFLFGASIGPFTIRLMALVHEAGLCDEATRDKDWLDYANQLYDGREPISEYDRLKGIVGEFCATRTKAELLELACTHQLLIAPVATPSDVLASAQFAARDYFDHVDDDVVSPGRPVVTPGPWVWSSSQPPVRLGRAPRLGEHAGVGWAERSADRPEPRRDADGNDRRAPLDGINVLDMTWAMAGPATTRVMADFGAVVVRIETSTRLDVARTIGPFVKDVPGNDASGLLFNMSVGKRSVSVDLRTEAGREVLGDLVRWADVIVESFSPRGRASLGLDFERLHALHPGVIMMSSCLFGQSGPLDRYAGFGTMGASLSGFFHLTGWPDRPPCGPFGAYSDYPSPRFAMCALLAALDHRDRTGEGQYLDFAQAEACAHFIAPALLDQGVNGHESTRSGNVDPHMVPHGVYPCAGEEQWLALACRDDADWRALAPLVGRDDLADLGAAERAARRDELDGVVASWSQGRSVADVMALAIGAGVPAHAVQNSGECMDDPQLQHLAHWVSLPHPDHGTIVVEGARMHLSETPAAVTRTPPLLGQDTFDVLTDLLGYDGDRLGELFAAGALE